MEREEDGAGESDRGGRVEGSLVEESIVERLAGGEYWNHEKRGRCQKEDWDWVLMYQESKQKTR